MEQDRAQGDPARSADRAVDRRDAARRFRGRPASQLPRRAEPDLDVQPYLAGSVFTANYGSFDDKDEIALYEKKLHETDGGPAARLDAPSSRSMSSIPPRTEIWVAWWYRPCRTAPT